MRGKENYNFEAFFVAEALLEMRGHQVANPARMDLADKKAWWSPTEKRINLAQDFTLQDALKRDIGWMVNFAEAIVLLPGWEDSEGAAIELDFARTVGLEVCIYRGPGLIAPLDESVNAS